MWLGNHLGLERRGRTLESDKTQGVKISHWPHHRASPPRIHHTRLSRVSNKRAGIMHTRCRADSRKVSLSSPHGSDGYRQRNPVSRQSSRPLASSSKRSNHRRMPTMLQMTQYSFNKYILIKSSDFSDMYKQHKKIQHIQVSRFYILHT